MSGGVAGWRARYRDEVLRWNASINLVSRQDSAARLDALLTQCEEAGARLLAHAPPAGPVLYLDVGAGGGLPGVAWHGLLHEAGLAPRTWLVEPREKRAWFLARVARDLPPGCGVLRGAWGETGPDEAAPTATILVSLKALHLDDARILTGLDPFLAGPAALTVARFYPPDQAWTPALAARLAVPAVGEARAAGGLRAVLQEAGVLPAPGPEGAGLVVTRYALTRS